MITTIRTLLFAQILVFAYAAIAHFGLVGNRDDPGAGTAETVIAVVLLASLGASLMRPAITRVAALIGQGFALLGTCVGFTLLMTVGPRTAFDLTMHGAMFLLLGVGLVVTTSWQRDTSRHGIA